MKMRQNDNQHDGLDRTETKQITNEKEFNHRRVCGHAAAGMGRSAEPGSGDGQ